MSVQWVEVRLKMPDNTAYTTLFALRRLGVEVAHVERAFLLSRDVSSEREAVEVIRSDESVFNPQLHEVCSRSEFPLAGEVFVLSSGYTTIWRMVDDDGEPVERSTLEHACEVLLCNLAVEEAVFPA